MGWGGALAEAAPPTSRASSSQAEQESFGDAALNEQMLAESEEGEEEEVDGEVAGTPALFGADALPPLPAFFEEDFSLLG